MVVVPGAADSVEYRFDDTRPEGIAARRLVDDALQRGAGRTDPVPVGEAADPGAGLALHRLRGAGPPRHEPAGQRHLGHRLCRSWTPAGSGCSSGWSPRRCPKSAYLASFIISRLALLVLEAGLLLAFGTLVFGVPLRGSLGALGAHLPARLARLRRPRPAGRGPAAHHRGRVGPDESGDGADVGVLRGLLLLVPLPRSDSAVRAGACRSPR